MANLHPDLKRHVTIALLACSALGVLGAILLLAAVVDIPGVGEVPTVLLIFAGAAFIGIGYTGVTISPKWYKEASRIVARGSPVRARVTLHLEDSSDSTTLNARMESLERALPIPPDEISLLIPRWDFSSYLDTTVDAYVFLLPETGRVAAIRTPRGLLWALPNWRWPRKVARPRPRP
jgi:hypothetical protein